MARGDMMLMEPASRLILIVGLLTLFAISASHAWRLCVPGITKTQKAKSPNQ
jgi:hypothetical protein